jgi:DNA-binding response OmpR family regulator
MKRVLIIEDEPGIAKACTRTLNAEGFQVDHAVNGRVALDILQKNGYDLCLIDIITPEMNGIELYQQLKDKCPHLVSKVIFTTGDVLTDNVKAFLDKVDRPFLAKPFTPDELRTIVKAVLSRN